MSEQRTIILNMDAVQQQEMWRTTNPKDWDNAIGYLATWNMTFPTVEIYADGKTDMVAVYKDKDGKRGYVIGAVWHENHYGFHS